MNAWKPHWKDASAEVQRVHAQEGLIDAIGHALRQMLTANHMTQATLAKRLGKTEGHISQLLNGKNLTLRTLADICYAAGIQATARFVAAAPVLIIVASNSLDMPGEKAPANTEVYMRPRPRLELVAKMAPQSPQGTSFREVA